MANYVKFMRGTTNAYNKLQTKDDDTLYFLSDNDGKEGSLYLGTKLIAGPDVAGATSLGELSDILLTPGMDYDAILMYDSIEMKWRDYSFDALTFRAATETLKGASGFVPAPEYNERHMFLRGDGTWAAAGAECQIFNNIKTSVDQSHADALIQSTTGFILNKGDVAIVQDFIVNGKYQYTSYIYNGDEWCALDKEYSADNVYLKSNINDLETSGKNLTEAFELIVSQMQDIITTDTTTITIDSNELSLRDFGKRFYKYIPANDSESARYELQEVDEDHPWAAGLEPKVANENGVLVLGWYEPNPTTLEGINSTITALQGDVNNLTVKINNTYTKAEVEEKIAAAPHLKRKKVSSKEEIDLAAADADQYIYMIPTGFEGEDNKYDEYIVIETKVIDDEGIETVIKAIERVGTWEVDLSEYDKKDDVDAIGGKLDSLNNTVYGYTNEDGEELPGLTQLMAAATKEITILTQRADKVDKNLTEGLKAVNAQIITLNERADKVDGKIIALEKTVQDLDKTYVSIVNFNKVVGDMDTLLSQQINIMDEINNINQRLTWGIIPEETN